MDFYSERFERHTADCIVWYYTHHINVFAMLFFVFSQLNVHVSQRSREWWGQSDNRTGGCRARGLLHLSVYCQSKHSVPCASGPQRHRSKLGPANIDTTVNKSIRIRFNYTLLVTTGGTPEAKQAFSDGCIKTTQCLNCNVTTAMTDQGSKTAWSTPSIKLTHSKAGLCWSKTGMVAVTTFVWQSLDHIGYSTSK